MGGLYLDTIHKKGEFLHLTGQFEKGIMVLKEGITIAQHYKDKTQTAKLQALLGEILYRQGDYDQALIVLEQAQITIKDMNKPFIHTTTLRNIGFVYRNKGKYDHALEYFQQALAICEAIGDKLGIAMSLNGIGIVYDNKGDYDRALDYLQQSLTIYESIGDKHGIATSLGNIGIVYRKKGDNDSALDYYQQALAIYEAIGNKLGITFILANIGVIYSKKDMYNQAIDYLQQSLVMKEDLAAKGSIDYNYAYLAYSYAKQGNYQKALDMAYLDFDHFDKGGIAYQHGQIYTVVGMVLAETPPQPSPSKGWEQDSDSPSLLTESGQWGEVFLMDKITALTQLPETPNAYFEHGLQTARNVGFMATLVPALYEYGKYLYQEGDTESGMAYLQEAMQLATEKGMLGEVRKIEVLTNHCTGLNTTGMAVPWSFMSGVQLSEFNRYFL